MIEAPSVAGRWKIVIDASFPEPSLWEYTALKDPRIFPFFLSIGDHLEVVCVLGRNLEASSSSAYVLQSGLLIIPACSILLLLFI